MGPRTGVTASAQHRTIGQKKTVVRDKVKRAHEAIRPMISSSPSAFRTTPVALPATAPEIALVSDTRSTAAAMDLTHRSEL